MQLTGIDWLVMALYGVVALTVGLYFARRAGQDREEFFLSGRKLPWWLLGTSMVATTFSTDTPNLVTDMVRTGGVSSNWLWWAFLITGMATVFFYARMWRRSEALTDIGFYELRYSGKPAAFLRGFRAIYLGFFFNVMIMATVTLAAIKISSVLLGLDKYTTVLICASITALYSATSGLWGVVVTDLLLFVIAMVGSLAAAFYSLQQPAVGGLSGLVNNPALQGKLNLLPDFSDWSTALAVFIIPISVQWWSTWYPGAEPGGGGYIAQRMLAARNEKDAMSATMWFNIAHYALRPWPWVLVALCSLAVYPTLESLQASFPGVDPSIMGHDLAYPAMLVFLPHGLLGLVVASLFYRRFVASDRDERHYVKMARISTVVLVVFTSMVAFWLDNALQAFQILLQIGAGTGLIFLLRWYWWRINAWSEISAMIISFSVAIYFQFIHEGLGFAALHPSLKLVLGVAVTTVGWLVFTMLTPPTDRATLQSFFAKIHPLGPGWRKVMVEGTRAGQGAGRDEPDESLTAAFGGWFLGCLVVYSALFGTGYLLYGNLGLASACFTVFLISVIGLYKLLPKVGFTA